ncbi:MAG TPA: gamma-glutamyl-gamma-aminobutyrate hydrolase family protein [Trinickia sp.]|nr:gamma-glutamyl-gamma-aminobutyrate hydrolase family protein [Trinickia sp.]
MGTTLVIVGASYAGVQLAASARERGYDGNIVLLGDEPEAPYQRPPLSKGFLTGSFAQERLPLRSPAFFDEERIGWQPSTRATRIDRARREVALSRGSRIAYDHLALTTGARPRMLECPGASLNGVHCLRDLRDARHGKPAPAAGLADPARDHVALAIMRMAAARGMPFLAICRGFQEMNVAFGGTLDADIYASGCSTDHREDLKEALVTRYRFKHEVILEPGGILHGLTGAKRIRVNSLHMQGVDKLAPPLSIEAVAPDGLIESFRHPGNPFALGVQWHPEVLIGTDLTSRALFEEFGEACRRFERRPR